MAETWRVVLASGEVRELALRQGHSAGNGSGYYATDAGGFCVFGVTHREAVVCHAFMRSLPVAEILAPGEPTRAELAAQLAAARYLAQKDRDTQTDALGHALATLRDSVLAALGAQPHEDAADVAQRVTRERDVALGQIGPLLDAHDALVAAARAAGWTGAGATGAELVAWVRRGEREACAALLETAADEREYAAGRSDDAVDHHDLCTRAKHLRGAAALLRLNTTWLPAKAVREGGE